MSVAIVQITQKELAAKAIKIDSEKLTFENQVFAKGPSFSLRCKEPALKYCQQIAKKKLKTLLIQEKYGFTIWTQSHQTKNQYLKHLDRKDYTPKTSSSTKAKQQSVSNSKISGKYRGQANEMSQKDSQDASTGNFLRKIFLRKYRGQYIN